MRFEPEVDRLRAAWQNRRGAELADAIQREIAQIRGAVLVADGEGRVLAGNDRGLVMTGYSTTELASLSVRDLTPLPDEPTHDGLWREFTESGSQRGTYRLRTRSGAVVTVRYWAFANVAPGVHVSVLLPANGAASESELPYGRRRTDTSR